MATIVLDGEPREVTVERSDDGYVVTVGGRRHVVSGVSAGAGTLAFFVGRTSHVAHISDQAEGRRLTIGGRGYFVSRGGADPTAPSGTGAGDGRLEAPMPGAIVAVHVTAGDRVKMGQAVVVLESMKMHNEIVSPLDGVVSRVGCAPGQQVAFGHVLVEIERGAA